MRYKVLYFQPKEFLCPCCRGGWISSLLVYHLDVLRRVWGNALLINSGWRCEAHNKEVGGADNSRHLIGCAADVAPVNGLIAPFKSLVKSMFGDRQNWEIIYYPTFVHIAVPKEEKNNIWSGNLITVTAI